MATRMHGLAMLVGLTLTACEHEGTRIGPEGGVVQSGDGRLTLEIPAGALEDTLAIDIVAHHEQGRDGFVGSTYAIEPYGVGLLRPARLSIDLSSPDGVERLEHVAAGDLELRAERDEGWVKLADHEVDWETGTVSASVLYFSTFVVMPVD